MEVVFSMHNFGASLVGALCVACCGVASDCMLAFGLGPATVGPALCQCPGSLFSFMSLNPQLASFALLLLMLHSVSIGSPIQPFTCPSIHLSLHPSVSPSLFPSSSFFLTMTAFAAVFSAFTVCPHQPQKQQCNRAQPTTDFITYSVNSGRTNQVKPRDFERYTGSMFISAHGCPAKLPRSIHGT